MPKFSPVVSRRRRFSSVLAVLALAVLTAAGCDSSTGNDNSIASLSVNPSTPVMHVGGVQQLTATAATSSGNILEGRTTAWVSSNPGVATVDGGGLVTAVAGGSSTISATDGSVSDDATVTVWFPVQSVTLASAGGATSVCQEGTLQLTPTFIDANGATVTGRQSVWTTGDPTIADVSTAGLVNGGPPGGAIPRTTTITAVTEGVTATFDITTNCVAVVDEVELEPTLGAFMAPGMTDQFVVTPLAPSGTELDTIGRTVTFATSDAAVATVSATGVVTLVAEGEADITATVDGVDSDPVTVEGYPELVDGVVTNTGPIALDQDLYWVVDVPAGTQNITVALVGGDTPDTDLVVYGPTGSFEGFDADGDSNETVSLDASASEPLATGRWLVRWIGYEAHPGATLTATVTP